MPIKKHRLSWMYEVLPAENAHQIPTEDTLAISPVEVSYPSDVLAESVHTQEPPAPEEEPPNDTSAEMPPADEYSIVEEGPAAEEYPIEVTPAEEYPIEATPAEEYPVEATPADEYPVVEEARPAAEAPVAEGEPAISSDYKAYDSEEETAGNTEKLQDRAREVVSICASCTIMLFTEYEGPCPYSFTSLMGPDHESYSRLLHTTCFSCVNKYKHEWVSREQFGNGCMTAFRAAMLSEEFMKGTDWFELAVRVCRKPIRIVMEEGRRSVAYMKIDDLREETTGKCRIRGLRSVGSRGEKGGGLRL